MVRVWPATETSFLVPVIVGFAMTLFSSVEALVGTTVAVRTLSKSAEMVSPFQ